MASNRCQLAVGNEPTTDKKFSVRVEVDTREDADAEVNEDEDEEEDEEEDAEEEEIISDAKLTPESINQCFKLDLFQTTREMTDDRFLCC